VGQSQSKTGFGIRAGANVSTLSNADLDFKSSVYIGAFMEFKFSKLYSLQLELGYSNQGGLAKNSINSDVKIHYISISAINKIFFQNSGLHFMFGPGLDFDIDDTLIGIANRNGDEGNDITFIDITISLGLGYEFKNGITLEVRYKQGIVDVFSGSFHNFPSQSRYETENQFNNVFQLGLAYKFNF